MKNLFLLFLLSSSFLYAQEDLSQREKILKEFMESRKAMMDKMLDAFGQDDFFEDDMDDSFFKSILGDRFKNFQSSKMVTVETMNNTDGTIDIFIRPIDQSVKLDIETKTSSIIVKAKQIEKVENENSGTHSFRSSNQSMTQTVPIPYGYTANPPKEVEGKILIRLVREDKKKVQYKTPLQKREGEGTI